MRISIGPSAIICALAILLPGAVGYSQTPKPKQTKLERPLGDIAREYRAKPRVKAVNEYGDDDPLFSRLTPMVDPQAKAREQLIKQLYEAGRRYAYTSREIERISKLTPAELENERLEARRALLLKELEEAKDKAKWAADDMEKEVKRVNAEGDRLAKLREEEERRAMDSRMASSSSSSSSQSSGSSASMDTQSGSSSQSSDSGSSSSNWQPQPYPYPYPHPYPHPHPPCCRPEPKPEPAPQGGPVYRRRY